MSMAIRRYISYSRNISRLMIYILLWPIDLKQQCISELNLIFCKFYLYNIKHEFAYSNFSEASVLINIALDTINCHLRLNGIKKSVEDS